MEEIEEFPLSEWREGLPAVLLIENDSESDLLQIGSAPPPVGTLVPYHSHGGKHQEPQEQQEERHKEDFDSLTKPGPTSRITPLRALYRGNPAFPLKSR